MRYLNPKADLTFKKVFGEHPDLVASFLNALLPFDSPEERIEHVEYLPSELVPQNAFTQEQHCGCTLQRQARTAVHRRNANGMVIGIQTTGSVQRIKSLRTPNRRRRRL